MKYIKVWQTVVDLRPQFFSAAIFLSVISGLLAIIHELRLTLRKSHGKEEKKRSGPLFVIGVFFLLLVNSVLSFYEIELINNYYIIDLKFKYIALGVGITLVLYAVILFFVNSLSLGMIVGNLFFLLWGTANYFVNSFRTIPLQWIDFSSIRTAWSVSSGYEYKLTWQIVLCISCTVLVLIFYIELGVWHNFRKTGGKILSRIISIALIFSFYAVIFRTDFLADTGIWLRDWQPWYTYRLFGMEAGFFAFAKASYPEEPEGYSEERIEEIIQKSKESDAAAKGGSDVIPENIIVIMNESFSDLSCYPGLVTDVDPLANFHALSENTQKGTLMVSVVGGTTANTEFEFLTGNSMMISPSTVVYNSYIKQDQFSLARTLSSQGYTSYAIHPYYPNGWNREIVYPKMGFDYFLSIDEFEDPEYIRKFVSDKADYDKVIDVVEHKKEGEDLFIFNVTMQNHSGYEDTPFESDVHVIGYDGGFKDQAEQYLTLVKESDEAIMYLLDHFKNSDEPTLILFFGDHQPALDDDFKDYLYQKSHEDISFTEQQKVYETVYFVWANYDLPESQGQPLSANMLGSYLLSLTGLKSTGYDNFVANLPSYGILAQNAFGYLGTDGEQHVYGFEENETIAQKLKDYKSLIYNELTGGSSRDQTFYGITS